MRQPRQRQFNEDRVTLYSQKVPGPYWQVLVMLLMLMACCSLKPFFFFTLLAKTTAVEEQTTKQGAVFLQYHTAVSQERLFLLLGRLLMRRDYRPIIITQINHQTLPCCMIFHGICYALHSSAGSYCTVGCGPSYLVFF